VTIADSVNSGESECEQTRYPTKYGKSDYSDDHGVDEWDSVVKYGHSNVEGIMPGYDRLNIPVHTESDRAFDSENRLVRSP
jgi:hypothetical protein